MEFPRQEYRSGLQFPPSGYLPNPGVKPTFPALAGGFFTTNLPAKHTHTHTHTYAHTHIPNNYLTEPGSSAKVGEHFFRCVVFAFLYITINFSKFIFNYIS